MRTDIEGTFELSQQINPEIEVFTDQVLMAFPLFTEVIRKRVFDNAFLSSNISAINFIYINERKQGLFANYDSVTGVVNCFVNSNSIYKLYSFAQSELGIELDFENRIKFEHQFDRRYESGSADFRKLDTYLLDHYKDKTSKIYDLVEEVVDGLCFALEHESLHANLHISIPDSDLWSEITTESLKFAINFDELADTGVLGKPKHLQDGRFILDMQDESKPITERYAYVVTAQKKYFSELKAMVGPHEKLDEVFESYLLNKYKSGMEEILIRIDMFERRGELPGEIWNTVSEEVYDKYSYVDKILPPVDELQLLFDEYTIPELKAALVDRLGLQSSKDYIKIFYT